MIKFNPENKEILTYGECLEPAMEITDAEEAKNYLTEYTVYQQKMMDKEKLDYKGLTAEQIAKQNLGYFAGYYNDETRLRIEELFICSHPFFGKAENGIPTNREAFEIGVNYDKKRRKQ
jgi:hypothetical protein